MSEILNNKISEIPVNRIVAPTLNSAEYATTLGEAFENINDNFSLLANYNFIKGDAGSSVSIKAVNFTEMDGDKSFEEKLKEYIASTGDTTNITVMINGRQSEFSVWDNFDKNPGQLYMIYNKVNELDSDTEEAISSLYYVFLDGRYANDKIGEVENKEVYNNITDLSCVVVYENGGFKGLPNAFPTIYYEKNIGLCWKVNGNNTGLPVQGIPGQNGINATIQIVKCNNVTLENGLISGKVNDIFDIYNGYRNVELISSNNDFDINIYDKQAAVVLVTDGTVVGSTGQGFYFGALEVRDNELYANCNTEYAINYGISTQTVINAMREINLLNKGVDGSSGMKGLFVPITETKEDGTQPVHLLSATSITNTEGQTSDDKIDVILTPVSDLEALNEINSKDAEGNEKHLQVDKYLYLKINAEMNFLNDLKNINNINTKNTLANKNYTLKYKLEHVIKTVNDALFTDSSSIGDGKISMYFGEVPRNDNDKSGSVDYVVLSKNNTMYYDIYKNVYDVEHTHSIPKSFLYRLTEYKNGQNTNIEFLSDIDEYLNTPKTGIYQWRLCESDNTIKMFDAVYTTTVNPSISSEYMWFNGVENEVVRLENSNYTKYENGKYAIPGWDNKNFDKVFSFVKFVPTFDNDFLIENDTALNINYNVNITGDEKNPTRSITVNGAINCDDLSVYNLTATGEIKNIYTKDNIVSDAGIKLGKILGTNEYNTAVDNEGNINASGSLKVPTINASEISVNSINSDILTTDDFEVHNTVVGNNVKSITIKRNTTDNAIHVINNDMSLLQNNNSTIIVSDEDPNNQLLYCYGTETELAGKKPGDGVSSGNDIVNTCNFDDAKNFNIHRFAIQKQTKTKESSIINSSNINSSFSDLIKSSNYSNDLESSYYAGSADIGNSRNNLNNYSMQKFELKNDINNVYSMDLGDSLKFSNDCSYVCQIGIKGQCNYSYWPLLSNESYLKLSIYYTIEGDTQVHTLKSDFCTYKFAGAATNNTSSNLWVGYNNSGKLLNKENKSHNSNTWRYYAYAFKIPQVSASVTTEIRDAFNAGSKITFYLYPKMYLKAFGEKHDVWDRSAYCISGVYGSVPMAVYKTDAKLSGVTLYTTKLVNIGYYEWTNASKFKQNAIQLTYSYTNTNQDLKKINSTTLCDNGVVTRAGEYVFGLGYSKCIVDHNTTGGYDYAAAGNPTWKTDTMKENVPVLFYYKHAVAYYNENGEPNGSDNTYEGYAKRTNAIPLEDIFNLIKHTRESTNWKFGV